MDEASNNISKNVKVDQIATEKEIDPHFSEAFGRLSPQPKQNPAQSLKY